MIDKRSSLPADPPAHVNRAGVCGGWWMDVQMDIPHGEGVSGWLRELSVC